MQIQAQMKSAVFIICMTFFTLTAVNGQDRINGLPPGARIIETQPLNSKAQTNRALILWMLHSTKHQRDSSDEFYSCPEYTRGSYYSGLARVSLIDSKKHQIINTIKVKPADWEDNEESFDVPYQIKKGLYYRVEGVGEEREGKPVIMWLRDYNGDGKALEFALFDALACMGLQTTLIGYSEARDRVVQYPIKMVSRMGRKRSIKITHWVDYLFSKNPNRPGYWKYEIDYRGRGGPLDQYEIRYDTRKERFEGTLVYRMDDN